MASIFQVCSFLNVGHQTESTLGRGIQQFGQCLQGTRSTSGKVLHILYCYLTIWVAYLFRVN